MNPSLPNTNFFFILVITALLSVFISPTLSLPAPHPPVQSLPKPQNSNTALFRRVPTPAHTLYTISGCHKHVPAECKGLIAGRIGEEAYCSPDGTYNAHNSELEEKCKSFGCGCKKKEKWSSKLFGWL